MTRDRAGSIRKSGLDAYATGLKSERKYATERQLRLKGRVFTTFDQLLRHRGMAGLSAGTRLVDLGSADGALVTVARQAGLDASGLDVSDGLDFELDTLPLGDASVDVFTAVSLIEHLRAPTNLLMEVLRCLRPGGALVLVTPNWTYSSATFFDDPTHVKPYSAAGMHRALAQHGFPDPYVVPWLVMKPAWMWDLPHAFAFARYALPFRGDAPAFVPEFLRGRSGSILAMARKPPS